MPSGCFEQTSSTTYPNILALDYLRRTNKSVPEVEAKARQFIHLGYQRLLGFEVTGGGFDWFGRPPANRTLTAYGLMEFRDMARVHDVDANLIERTRRWLLAQRQPDGSWPAERAMLNDGLAGAIQRGRDLDLSTTAYIAWAVFDGQPGGSEAGRTLNYLLAHKPGDISDPYTLALLGNALLALNAESEAKAYLERMETMKKTSGDGKLVWWDLPATERTAFFGAGRGGSVETTALAVLALLKAKSAPGTASQALAWLVQQKDARGTWYSTQATVLALKALVAGTTAPKDGDAERRVVIAWQGGQREVVIPPDQAEVMQLVDLSDGLAPGTHNLTIREKGDFPDRLSACVPLPRSGCPRQQGRTVDHRHRLRPHRPGGGRNGDRDRDRREPDEPDGPDGDARPADPRRLRNCGGGPGGDGEEGNHRKDSNQSAQRDRVPARAGARQADEAGLSAASDDASESDGGVGLGVRVLRHRQEGRQQTRDADRRGTLTSQAEKNSHKKHNKTQK